MKRQIRFGTFETNSSSTHSLVMMNKADYEKFKNGEKFWYDDEILSRDEILKHIKEDYGEGMTDEEILEIFEDEAKTEDEFGDGYETFHSEFTTPLGETVVSIGYYGMDN